MFYKKIMKLNNRRKSARPLNVVYCHCFVMEVLNINSLLAHLDNLKILIDRSKIDVLETKLDCSIKDNEI